MSKATSLAFDIANGRHDLSKAIAPVLFAADTVLGGLIIWKIPCKRRQSNPAKHISVLTRNPDTEIDWEAYMAQVSQYLSGERDYSKIRGGTGPLVYPAAHVYMYAGLYRVTDEGRDVLLAQQLFAVVYMATLALVMACYRKAGVSSPATAHEICLSGVQLTEALLTRRRLMCSPFLFSQSACTVSSSCAASTTGSPCCSSGCPCTRCSGARGLWRRSPIRGASASR